MTNEIKFPTQAEMRAFEQAAHELRAETLKAGLIAISHMPKAALAGLRSWAARPAHA